MLNGNNFWFLVMQTQLSVAKFRKLGGANERPDHRVAQERWNEATPHQTPNLIASDAL